MKLVKLKNIVPNYLLSAQFDDQDMDEFERLISEWTDPEFLYSFFVLHSNLLFSGFYKDVHSIEDAVLRTIEEADRFSDMLLECDQNSAANLDDLFQPLHAHSTSIVREQSKAYGPRSPSWLRIYALRISHNYYAISGGGIKLTKTMQEGDNHKEHFAKLKVLANFLKANEIEGPDDYMYLDIEFQ